MDFSNKGEPADDFFTQSPLHFALALCIIVLVCIGIYEAGLVVGVPAK